MLPPGDLRMALSALCDDSEWGRLWRDVLQHRFASAGTLHDHALGNLLIVTLWELLGRPVGGLDWVARLLGARGRVLPMAGDPAGHRGRRARDRPGRPRRHGRTVRGQVAVATTPGPGDRRPSWCRRTRRPARRRWPRSAEADWVVLGPGSWFTSVLPHLLVPEAVRRPCTTTRARRCVTLNLAAAAGGDRGLLGGDPPRGAGRARPGADDRRRAGRPVVGGGSRRRSPTSPRSLGAGLVMRQVGTRRGQLPARPAPAGSRLPGRVRRRAERRLKSP